ncbi:MAG: hypothetical protein Aurels2KO_34020 [Aureliella sp.]
MKRFTFSTQLLLSITALVAVHLALRVCAQGNDLRIYLLTPFAVAATSSYWLAVSRAAYRRIYLVSFVVSLFSTVAVSAEPLFEHGSSGFYELARDPGSFALRFTLCLSLGSLLAGTWGAVIRGVIDYAYPPWRTRCRRPTPTTGQRYGSNYVDEPDILTKRMGNSTLSSRS